MGEPDVDPTVLHINKRNLTAEQFISLHEAQLTQCGVPKIHWEVLHTKLQNDVFDAGLDFSLMRVEYEDSDELGWRVIVSNPEGVTTQESENIYLVDHAWTYDNSLARQMLSSVDGLLDRMCLLMDIDDSPSGDSDRISLVLDKMWLYNQTYSFGGMKLGSADSMPLWYVLDEFGSRIQHSDSPTVKMVPFFYSPTQTAYSIFWPIKDMQLNDEVTRDYTPHIAVTEELARLAHLLPWNPCDFTEIDDIPDEPDVSYFKSSRCDDIDLSSVRQPMLPDDRPILVWTSDPVVEEYLTSDKFKLTDSRDSADIIWQNEHIRDFVELSQRCVLLNQFPYESLLTTKDLLAVVSRHAAPTGSLYPRWLPVTYNLNTELAEFLCYYQKTKQSGKDNHWIAKPWNLGRGLGHVITKNVNCLVRLPTSGPYVAVKYIEDPVLYNRPDDIRAVKFDYRYILLLKSVKPLRVSCYKKFFLRFANKPFSLDNLDDYDKHFTVHNYSKPEQLLNINCEDFVPEWNQQYPSYPWSMIEADTMQCILEMLEAASCKEPPFGIANYPQSRGHYAVDLMLKWDTDSNGRKAMIPQILEVNFTPDSKRGCKNYPQYFNDVFTALYMDDEKARTDTEIVIC